MMDNKYIPVIGLEIHVELNTKSKMFCQCSADYFGKNPNSNICPVCLGLPGALPVPNETAIKWMQLIGRALNCQLSKNSKFDRKHYNYPDLPKGYQISQYDEPFATKGRLAIENPYSKTKKTFGITRVHMEEDTAKLIHEEKNSLIDFNRSGVPLVEIVTDPNFNSAEDVKAFLEELQIIVRYLKVSDADMEKGSMRLEPNISVKKVGENGLPPYKIEVKNINSFRFVKQAIEYEIKRQVDILEKGVIPSQETRGWDDKNNKTYLQRSKEEAHDYRYFPEPDIPPFYFEKKYLQDIDVQIPELPQQKIDRYVNNYKIKEIDAFVLTRNRQLAEYYESLILKIENKKIKSNVQNYNQIIANLIINKKIDTRLTVDEFLNKASEISTPKTIDLNVLNEAVEKILINNPKVVADYKSGKTNAIMFLVGQIMRELKGQANANEIIEIIKKKI